MVEQFVYTEKVRGSSPLSPTNARRKYKCICAFCVREAMEDSKRGFCEAMIFHLKNHGEAVVPRTMRYFENVFVKIFKVVGESL